MNQSLLERKDADNIGQDKRVKAVRQSSNHTVLQAATEPVLHRKSPETNIRALHPEATEDSTKHSAIPAQEPVSPINIVAYQWQHRVGASVENLLGTYGIQILEIVYGFRDIEQLSRWMTPDAFHKLRTRATLAERHRTLIRKEANMHQVAIKRCVVDYINVEALYGTLLIEFPGRLRAAVIGLESFKTRWRISEIHIL